MGNDWFAIPSLKALLENDFNVTAVVTSPDKPQGRGLKLSPMPVKTFAQERKLPILSPTDLKSAEFLNQLKKLHPDAIVVVAFTILPEEIFSLPPLGTINLHPSLLPQYRGAAPIQWALINGDEETGVTTFVIEKKVDAGKIILQKKVIISPDEAYGELSERLSKIGADALVESLNLIQQPDFKPLPQDNSKSSKAPKIKKEDCRINWSNSALKIKNLIRGLSPEPGAFSTYKDKIVKIFKTETLDEKSHSDGFGEIILASDKGGLAVKTGQGSLRLLSLQLEGKKIISGEEFVRGYKVKTGEKFI
ncbi:MAG: Methionyl-tRNA formyltransferase [candidate division Zixibacteria bacterium RBG-1]|nr:MAG: Methionyl-tRNA formyltransferase [candidate division Zixibacteria bacterium RBG-1]